MYLNLNSNLLLRVFSIFKQRAAGNINYVASLLLWSAFVASEKLISDGGPDV